MDYSQIQEFNRGFQDKKLQEMLGKLPAQLRLLVKEALECQEEADFQQEEEIFREILTCADPKGGEAVVSLLSMIHGRLLFMDLEDANRKFEQDAEAYLEFLDTAAAIADVREDLVQNMTRLGSDLTEKWKRPLYESFLCRLEKKGYLDAEGYEGILPSAKAALEAVSYLEDRKVSQLMKQVLKSFYDISYTIHEEEDMETDADTLQLEALLSKWMLCCYEKEHVQELEYVEQTYPCSFVLMGEFVQLVREDADAQKKAILSEMMQFTAQGVELSQVEAAVMKQYEELLQQGFEPKRTRPADGSRRRMYAKVGRNDPCPCGSGRKYKQCCGR